MTHVKINPLLTILILMAPTESPSLRPTRQVAYGHVWAAVQSAWSARNGMHATKQTHHCQEVERRPSMTRDDWTYSRQVWQRVGAVTMSWNSNGALSSGKTNYNENNGATVQHSLKKKEKDKKKKKTDVNKSYI